MDPTDVLPRDVAALYLTTPWLVGVILGVNALAFLVGVRFYLDTMGAIPTWLWPLYGDSPTAIALATLVLAGTLPALGRAAFRPNETALDRARGESGVFAVVATFALVWLVETGVWTVVALNVPLVRPDLPADLYVGFGADSLWAYWGVVLTHAAFLGEAALLSHVARTSRRALAAAAVAVLVNDLFDYGFLLGIPTANHPPLRYEPGPLLAGCSVLTSVAAVAAVALVVPRVRTDRTDAGATHE